jgi:hypothetical protein
MQSLPEIDFFGVKRRLPTVRHTPPVAGMAMFVATIVGKSGEKPLFSHPRGG